jgi:hypothetical protein
MPLIIPKENATQEEINAWIVETQEKYNLMENDLQTKTARELSLLNENNKLFAKVTSKKTDDKDDTDKEEIPSCIDKETYEKLSDKEKQELNELLEEDEE